MSAFGLCDVSANRTTFRTASSSLRKAVISAVTAGGHATRRWITGLGFHESRSLEFPPERERGRARLVVAAVGDVDRYNWDPPEDLDYAAECAVTSRFDRCSCRPARARARVRPR